MKKRQPPSQGEGGVQGSPRKDDGDEDRGRQNRRVGRKNRRNYMLGDAVEVEILKVDALRHQIDLAVLAPEGETADQGPEAGPTGDLDPGEADVDSVDSDAFDGDQLEGSFVGLAPS